MTVVSIIIPVYNRDFELKRAINSVLKQTFQDFEIIVVDDYSDIDTESIINDFSDKRIKFFKLEKKGNGNICRNLGITEAKGEYIAMLDSDDEWLPQHLETSLNYLKTHNVDGVFGDFSINNGEGVKPVFCRPVGEKEQMANYLLSGNMAQTSTHVYKAGCAKNTLWDEQLFRNQDLDFTIRFADAYQFVPVHFNTCIVHWKKGERRNQHLLSNKKFIQKYENRISETAFHTFHANIYMKIYDDKSIDTHTKEYFLTNSTKDIRFCSLADFMKTHALGRKKTAKLFLRFIFIVRVFLS